MPSAIHYDNIDILQRSLTTAISEVNQWEMANKLPLIETKTKVLTVTGKRLSTCIEHDLAVVVNVKQLKNVQCAKLLGLEIDQELTFIPHIDKLCKKLSQRIGILKKIRHCLPLRYCLFFYNAMIRPLMTYVIVVWPSCDKHCLNRVFRLQKRAARIILDADSQASSVKLFYKPKWIPFYEQVKIAKCCIIYKRLQGHVPAYRKTLLKLPCETHS